MATREEAIVELYKRGALNDSQRQAVEELARRGQIQLPVLAVQDSVLQQQAESIPDMQDIAQRDAVKQAASEVSPLDAFLIGAGRGFATVGRGLGLMDQETEQEKAAMEALKEQRPYTTGAGEITGEMSPFLVPGAAIGKVPALAGRVLAGGVLGGAEGAILSSGQGDTDVVPETAVGISIGAGAELLAPVLSRIGRQVYARVRGSTPAGELIDRATGKPTAELQSALDDAGISFDDLTQEAQKVISAQKSGAKPEQVARAALFEQESIPATRGAITKDFTDEQLEARLIESGADKVAEPFRQYKLRQSEAIKQNLQQLVGESVEMEEAGNLVKDALTGRRNLLRTQKNALYDEALTNAKASGGIPLFTDSIASSVADEATIRRINRVTGGKADDVLDTLAEFGIVPREGIENIDQLSVANFEDLRQTLKALERSDQTGGLKVITSPVLDALDAEIDEVAARASGLGLGENVVEPLKKAREITKQMKAEFSPQSTAGQLINMKPDGVTPLIEGSKVYNKLLASSMPVENVRKVTQSLRASGEKGEAGMAAIKATAMLDLIDSGFSTASRQIDGVPVFNPVAFKKRLAQLSKDGKLQDIFKDDPKTLTRLKNLDKIAETLIPPAGAVPKGSASVILDMANKAGLVAITSKLPGGGLLTEAIANLAESGAARSNVAKALDLTPETMRIANTIDEVFPGVSAALGIGYLSNQGAE